MPVPTNKGPEPDLAGALDACNLNNEKKADICKSKVIPSDVVDAAKNQVSLDWEDDEIKESLENQCDKLYPTYAQDAGKDKKEKAAKETERKKREQEQKKEEEKKKKEAEKEKEKKEKDEKEAAAAAEKEKKKEEEEKKKAAEAEEKEREKKASDEDRRKREEEKKKEQAAKQKERNEKERQKQKEKEDKEKQKEKDKKEKEEAEKKRKEQQEKEKEEKEKEKQKKKEEKEREAERKRKEKEEKEKEKEEERERIKEEKAEEAEERKRQKEEEEKEKEELRKEKEAWKKEKDEERKKEEEERKKEKEEEDRQKAEEKKKKDEEDRIEKEAKKKADEERKAKEKEQRKKDEEAAKKRAEADKKKKEAHYKAEKQKEEEERKERREEERRKREEKRERKNARKTERKKSDDMEWDEETGQMVKRKFRGWDRSHVEDACCDEGDGLCCQAFSYICYFLFFPPIFAAVVYWEWTLYGFARFEARLEGHGYNLTDFNQPSPAPKVLKKFAPTPAPVPYQEMAVIYVMEHPMSYIYPAIGLAVGLFCNIWPMAPGLMLMPLFQELEITKLSNETMALAAWVQLVGSGLFGFFSWMGRNPRFFICRALFFLTPIGWCGYAVGKIEHLSFKDLLILVYENNRVDPNEDPKDYPETDGIYKDPRMQDAYEKADLDLLHTYLRLGLGVFMVVMSFFVLIGCCIGGVNHYCCPSRTGGTTPGCKSFCQWLIVMACIFNTGWMFVANIGSGMGIFSFFLLSMFLGVETKRALCTAIMMGAHAQIPEVIAQGYFYSEVPYIRLMLFTPFLWFGALLAPAFSFCGGPCGDLFFYTLVLAGVGTATVALAAIHLQKEKEDINIEITPMYSNPEVNKWFDENIYRPEPVTAQDLREAEFFRAQRAREEAAAAAAAEREAARAQNGPRFMF